MLTLGLLRLNGLARATGQELDEQNRHLRRLNEKVYFIACLTRLRMKANLFAKSTVVDDQIVGLSHFFSCSLLFDILFYTGNNGISQLSIIMLTS